MKLGGGGPRETIFMWSPIFLFRNLNRPFSRVFGINPSKTIENRPFWRGSGKIRLKMVDFRCFSRVSGYKPLEKYRKSTIFRRIWSEPLQNGRFSRGLDKIPLLKNTSIFENNTAPLKNAITVVNFSQKWLILNNDLKRCFILFNDHFWF